MSVERLNTVIRINFIEKVTFQKRFGVGKGMTVWISKKRTFQGEGRVRHRPQGEHVAGGFKKHPECQCGWPGESRSEED